MKIPKISLKIPKIKVYGIDVIKNALFFTLYIILSLFIIAFIIAPSIRIFKKTKDNYYITKTEFENTQNRYKNTLKEVEILKNKNRFILNKLKRDFNKKNFKMFAKNYMEVIDIKPLKPIPYKDKFIIYPYLITAKIKTPKNFYDFINNAKKYKNLIKVYFPIDFEKEKEDIKLTFKIESFKLKEKNENKNLL